MSCWLWWADVEMWGTARRSVSKAALISRIRSLSRAFAVLRRYLLNGGGFCFGLVADPAPELAPRLAPPVCSGSSDSKRFWKHRGLSEYFSPLLPALIGDFIFSPSADFCLFSSTAKPPPVLLFESRCKGRGQVDECCCSCCRRWWDAMTSLTALCTKELILSYEGCLLYMYHSSGFRLYCWINISFKFLVPLAQISLHIEVTSQDLSAISSPTILLLFIKHYTYRFREKQCIGVKCDSMRMTSLTK
jgi:hypothetical protein